MAQIKLATSDTIKKIIQQQKQKDAATLASAKSYTDTEIAAAKQAVKDELIGGAPATYDTLKEVADYIASHGEAAAALASQIGAKADKTYVDEKVAAMAGGAEVDSKIATAKQEAITAAATAADAKYVAQADISALTDAEVDAIVEEVYAAEETE